MPEKRVFGLLSRIVRVELAILVRELSILWMRNNCNGKTKTTVSANEFWLRLYLCDLVWDGEISYNSKNPHQNYIYEIHN